MANLAALLAAYALGPGDVVHVDTGTYDLVRNIVVTAQNSGVQIERPQFGDRLAAPRCYWRQQSFPRPTVWHAVRLAAGHRRDARSSEHDQRLCRIYAADSAGATGLTVTNSSIYGMGTYGVFLGQTNDFATISGNTLYGLPGGSGDDDQLYGIYLSSNDGKIIGNKVYDSDTGIANQFYNLRALIRDNEIYGNRYGIADNASTGSNPADVSLIANNVVHNNIFRGISSGFNGTARIIGNTVYGQSAVGAIGIESNQEVGGNVVYGNYDGIAGSSASNVHDNRVFNNSNVGIRAGGLVLANRVYSNSIGLQYVSGAFDGRHRRQRGLRQYERRHSAEQRFRFTAIGRGEQHGLPGCRRRSANYRLRPKHPAAQQHPVGRSGLRHLCGQPRSDRGDQRLQPALQGGRPERTCWLLEQCKSRFAAGLAIGLRPGCPFALQPAAVRRP